MSELRPLKNAKNVCQFTWNLSLSLSTLAPGFWEPSFNLVYLINN